MTIVIESDHYPVNAVDIACFGLQDRDVVDLFASNGLMGYFRHDLAAGLLYLSEQACLIYGVTPTTGPVNLMDVLSRIHRDDIELMLLTFEEGVRLGKGTHCVFRVEDGVGGYRHVRVISTYRDSGTPAGELAGIVHDFLERVPGVKFQHRDSCDAD